MMWHRNALIHGGFKQIKNPVMIFHARRSLGLNSSDQVMCFVRKCGYEDVYMHVALVRYSGDSEDNFKIFYTLARDAVLYGLREMYKHQATGNKTNFVLQLANNVQGSWPEPIKKRFTKGCIKPRVRATNVWLHHVLGWKLK